MVYVEEGMPARVDGLLERVRLEILALLGRTGECDLGTIYRTLIDLLGSEATAEVGVILGRLIRERAIEVETRSLGHRGPLIGVARLVARLEPPYHALTA